MDWEGAECAICLVPFAEILRPVDGVVSSGGIKVLPCGHSLCHKDAVLVTQCPICELRIDPDIHLPLPNNYLAQALIEAMLDQQKKKSELEDKKAFESKEDRESADFKSGLCSKCDKAASFHCEECGALFCCKHDAFAHLQEELSKHKRVAFSSKSRRKALQKCPHHGEKLTFYCTDDDSLACAVCVDGAKKGVHSDHKVSTLEESWKLKIDELKESADAALEFVSESDAISRAMSSEMADMVRILSLSVKTLQDFHENASKNHVGLVKTLENCKSLLKACSDPVKLFFETRIQVEESIRTTINEHPSYRKQFVHELMSLSEFAQLSFAFLERNFKRSFRDTSIKGDLVMKSKHSRQKGKVKAKRSGNLHYGEEDSKDRSDTFSFCRALNSLHYPLEGAGSFSPRDVEAVITEAGVPLFVALNGLKAADGDIEKAVAQSQVYVMGKSIS